MTFPAEAEAFLARHRDLQSLEVLFSDISGILRGKEYPASELAAIARKGMMSPASHLMLDASGHTEHPRLGAGFEGDPDVPFLPVDGSLRIVPWREVPTAQLLTHSQHFADPRGLVQRALQPLTEMGLTPVVALELELYLFDAIARPLAAARPSNGLPRLEGTQCMSLEVLDDYRDVIADMTSVCRAQGIPVTSIFTEFGDGQFEANLHHKPDVLAACDDAMLMKRALKAVARRRGQVASFMAKPIPGNSSSGMHIHMSLLDAQGRNVFGGKEGERLLGHAIGGLKATMAEATLLFAPNANSYRRYEPGQFVPLEPTWAANERGVAIRLPPAGKKDARLEHRTAGADACPYLVAAAVLAGVHHGLENKLDPGPMSREAAPVASARLPDRWPFAIRALEESRIIPRYLGAEFIGAYLNMKRFEEQRYHAELPDRDLAWYFRTV
jgi:glutamine synthetase